MTADRGRLAARANSRFARADQRATRINDARYELASEEAIGQLQWRKLQDMLSWVGATNSFYARKWRGAGVDLASIDSLERFTRAVPAVEKADFVADQADAPPFGSRLARALELGMQLDVYTTSGTSGQGVETHAQTARELAEASEMYRFGFCWAGMHRGDMALLTLPLTMMAGGRMELHGAVAAGLTVLPAGAYSARDKLALLRKFRPKALYGSTTYLGHLAAISEQDPAGAGIEVLLAGLEGTGLSYLARLEAQWGAKAYDRFGATQVRADWMFTCEHGVGSVERPGLLHNLDPWVLLEVIDPDSGAQVRDGEVGELVVTSLYHYDTPVVRCRLRDKAVYHDASYCGCGRPFGGIEVASIARTDDVKKIKGVNVFPEAVDNILYQLRDVDEYQVQLSSSDTGADVATVRIMPKRPMEANQRDAFRTAVAEQLRERIGLTFEVELCADLPRSEYKARRWHDGRARV